MSSETRRILAPVVMTLWTLWVSAALAQISPGPLSKPHADLEGSDRCLKCHSQKKRISAETCLDCHEILRDRLAEGLGYHASLTEQGCERCHMEHHGRDFQLVYWGEAGEAAFDHVQTSFELRGAHQRLECRACHKESLIRSPDRLRQKGKDLNRTFLGLDGSSCLSCHQDEHRGQFAGRPCEACHGLEKWTGASLFDHDSARYSLVGRHKDVVCDRCHSMVSGESSNTTDSWVRYVDLEFDDCTDCHRDPHEKRFGANCRECHSESGWRSANLEGFDHGRTRFALEGAHRQIRCEACHPNGVAVRLNRFGNCSDCHADHHLGQFATRPSGADCDSCHNVQGFSPARFSLAAHQESDYPLAGAHLAVACDRCHLPLDEEQIRARLGSVAGTRMDPRARQVYRYDFPSTLCSTCHGNPHEASLNRFMLERDCLTCHSIASWRQIEFDHERTDYSLVGGHGRATCVDCHLVEDAGAGERKLRFEGLRQDCAACHQDPHAGQFEDNGAPTTCTRCHSLEAWQRLRFDHQRDSSFALDGVHVRVECEGCHPTLLEGDNPVVQYKPLGQQCRDCHSGQAGAVPPRG